jgi:hypothetical protein
MTYDEQEIDEYDNKLDLLSTGIPAAIVYDLDEVESESWINESGMAVVTSNSYTRTEIVVSSARSDSPASMIAVSPQMVALSDSMTPFRERHWKWSCMSGIVLLELLCCSSKQRICYL